MASDGPANILFQKNLWTFGRKSFTISVARIKTGQDLRSQKNRLKTQVIRIFCELLAKTGAETRIDTGFFEGYCRNEEKLVQGIDTLKIS